MPQVTQSTGPHAPITNIPISESSVGMARVSFGSTGFGDEAPHDPEARIEVVTTSGAEAAVEFVAPDLSGLADVGVASFGAPAGLEAVLGSDERLRVPNTSQYPWRLSASLLITATDNSQWIGTGWFISPRTLVTAGHCVFIKHSGVAGRDGWVKKIQVMPGRKGSHLPFGGLSATEFWTVRGWGDDGLELYDYGAIVLPAPFSGDLGTFGFGVFDDGELLASTVNVAGYPGDKEQGTLWYDHRAIGSVKADKVFYSADTAGGQSGACVYVIQEGQRVAVAIHAYGGATANSGTRISSQVFDNLSAWKLD